MSTLTLYQDLNQQLREALRNLESLYHERTKLQQDLDGLRTQRQLISDELFEHLQDSQALHLIQGNLEQADRDIHLQDQVLHSLNAHIQPLEQDLHQLTPKACHTFERLYTSFRTHTFQLALDQIASLIQDPSDFQREISQLAEASLLYQDSQLDIPSGGTYSLTRPLDSDRQNTLKFVQSTAQALTTAADDLLQRLAELPDLDLPDFCLGLPPEPSQPQPEPPPNFSADDFLWQSASERDYAIKLCKDAGKDLTTLTDPEKLVLQHSISNFRSQLQIQSKFGSTSWDGTRG